MIGIVEHRSCDCWHCWSIPWSIPQDPNTSVVTKARTYRTTWDWHQHPPLPWILSYFSSSGSRADLGGAKSASESLSVSKFSQGKLIYTIYMSRCKRWNFMRNIRRPAMPGSIKTTADIVRSFRGPYWNSLCMGLFEMPWWLLEVFQKSLWTAILGTFRICWIYRCQRRLLRVCVCVRLRACFVFETDSSRKPVTIYSTNHETEEVGNGENKWRCIKSGF